MRRVAVVCFWTTFSAINSGPAFAACTLSAEPPRFTDTLNPDQVPKPADNISCPTGIENYRSELELYRTVKIETYNRKLISFGTKLKTADDKFRQARVNGLCTSDEYENFKAKASEEFEKIGNEYKDPYDLSIESYKIRVKQYKQLIFKCLVSSAGLIHYAEK